MKSHKSKVLCEGLAEEIYFEVEARLMKYTETLMARELRLRREWDSRSKGKHMNALQFEAV